MYEKCKKCKWNHILCETAKSVECISFEKLTPVDQPGSAGGSIAWVSVKDRLPKKDQYVLVCRKSRNRCVAVQTVAWWHGCEEEYTHWAKIEIPPKSANPLDRVDMPTDKPQIGTWVSIAPDGRKYEAESPIRCCRSEQNERIPERVRIARLLEFVFDEDEAVK